MVTERRRQETKSVCQGILVLHLILAEITPIATGVSFETLLYVVDALLILGPHHDEEAAKGEFIGHVNEHLPLYAAWLAGACQVAWRSLRL